MNIPGEPNSRALRLTAHASRRPLSAGKRRRYLAAAPSRGLILAALLVTLPWIGNAQQASPTAGQPDDELAEQVVDPLSHLTQIAAVEMCRELMRRGEHAEIYTTNADGNGCLNVPVGKQVVVSGVPVIHFAVAGSKYYKISPRLCAALKTAVPRFDLVSAAKISACCSIAAI